MIIEVVTRTLSMISDRNKWWKIINVINPN